MNTVHIARSIDAPINEVWKVAGNFLKSPGADFFIETLKEGDPDTHIGAERQIGNGKVSVIERLDSVDPMNNFTYTLLSGFLPVKDYHGKVEFHDHGHGTDIDWKTSFKPNIPGSGWIVSIIVKRMLNAYLDDVAMLEEETYH